MKTNITIDNYEAYLLDYMEGNLGKDETAQLKTFVAAQGLDWDELTEPLPHLEAPNIVYDNKENLGRPFDKLRGLGSLSLSKRQAERIVPLYVKIASAAAAAGLLLAVTLWPERKLPPVETIATLKPILPKKLITAEETTTLPHRTIAFKQTHNGTNTKTSTQTTAVTKASFTKRETSPLLAALQPVGSQPLSVDADADQPDFGLIAYRLNTEFPALALEDDEMVEPFDDDRELSLIRRGIYRLTNGRHDSFASLISSGLNTAKNEFSIAATDAALTAYHRADARIEEAKQRWEERKGE